MSLAATERPPRRDIEPPTRNVHWRSVRVGSIECRTGVLILVTARRTKLPMPVVMVYPPEKSRKKACSYNAPQSCSLHDSIFYFSLQRP